MKKITFVLILFFVFYVTMFSDVVALKSKKIILTSQDLSPLGFYDEKGNYDGIAVKVVKYALEKMNIEYEINIYPWARAQMLVKSGEADGYLQLNEQDIWLKEPSQQLLYLYCWIKPFSYCCQIIGLNIIKSIISKSIVNTVKCLRKIISKMTYCFISIIILATHKLI